MAKRPVFIPQKLGNTLVLEKEVEFTFHNGFSVSQKQKSIESLHFSAQSSLNLSGEILEVSTKSSNEIGIELSAFNLTLNSRNHGSLLLEAAFQGSKVFSETGQDTYIYELDSGSEIKKRISRRSDQELMKFSFDGTDWDLEPKTAFYDWLYLHALKERDNEGDVTQGLQPYGAFTDIEFNPKRSINCQARSCALFLALRYRNLLDEALTNKQTWLSILCDFGIKPPPEELELDI